MQISISGKRIKIGQALQQHVEEELIRNVSKFFEKAVSADVVFTKTRHLFRTDIIVNEGSGNNIIVKSKAEENDVYASFDVALDKIAKQLRRYKSKIRNHHKQKSTREVETAMGDGVKYVLSSKDKDIDKDSKNESPLIIAEKKTKIDKLTVGEAVMVMDLGDLPALMFINRKSGAISVVYRREDGNISWVDSGLKSLN